MVDDKPSITGGLEQMQRDALIRERDFWVNQARALQNQVSMWQTMYSNLLSEIAKGEVNPNVAEAVDLATQALQAPLTSVEAIRGFTAMQDPLTQGEYTRRLAIEESRSSSVVNHARDRLAGRYRDRA